MSEVGEAALRAEVVDKTVKGFATASYKFKQAVSISTTAAWKNFFLREASAALVSPTGNAIKGIPRGANFPQAVVSWEKVPTWVEKYGLEDNIYWEDILTNDVDVQARTLFRIAEGVVKAVDDEIWDVLTEGQSPTNIHTFTITNTATVGAWNTASAAIIDDLMHAKELIGRYNYPVNNLMAFISPKDHRSIVKYLADSGAQFPKIGEDMARNGNAGILAGVKLIISNSVTASYALVVVPKIVGTWKAAVPLRTETVVDPFKSVKIRAVEMGVTQLTDPGAACLIVNTEND